MYVGQDVIYESPNLHRSSVANPGALDCVRRDVGHFVHNVCFSARYEYGIIKFHLVLLGRVGFNFVVSFYLVSFVGQESYTNLLTVHFLGRY